MQIIIIDCHPRLHESRIERHLNYCRRQGYTIFRVHINYHSMNNKSNILSSEIIPTYELSSQYCQNRGKNFIMRKLFYLSTILPGLIKYNKIIQLLHINCDEKTIIHVHDPEYLPFSVNFSKFFKDIKIVYDRHEHCEYYSLNPFSYPSPIMRCSEYLTKKIINGVVLTMGEYTDVAQKFFPKAQITAVPNYPSNPQINSNIIKNKINEVLKNDPIKIVYFGSLQQGYYDIELILNLATCLLSENYNVEFILGGGTDDSYMLTRFKELTEKYPYQFRYVGWVPMNVVSEYTQKAVFGLSFISPESEYWVLHSPNKVFDYLACGTIPIVRDEFLNKDKIREGSMLFEREDTTEYIIQEIKKILLDKEQMATKIEIAYQLGQKYTFESVADEYTNLYDNLFKRE